MGCRSSKSSTNDSLRVEDATSGGREIIIESEDIYDRQVINYIKDEISNNPERFLLNNLLMCMVFFRNYEKDLYDFSNTAISKEEFELNSKLVTEVKKCILSDALLEKIQENIKFWDGEEEQQISDKTVYVVNDNIEVKDRNDVTLYTSIEIPGCQVQIEEIDEDNSAKIFLQGKNQGPLRKKEGTERKGFLKLRVLETSLSKMKPKYFLNRSVGIKTPETSKPTTPEEELEEHSDEYSTITAFKTPKNLNIVRTSRRRDTLPEACFEVRKIRKLTDTLEESESEQEESDNETDGEDDLEGLRRRKKISELYEDVTYLSSKGFMEYFQNEVFPNSTGKMLGFNEDEIESAQAMPGSILCHKNKYGEDIPLRIIPAVAIDWPSQATEYIYRKSRNTIIDNRDGIVYKWPTNEMVSELKTLNCVVIPKGFVMKKGDNEDSDIEWEIHFPKAGRYLEMRMSHPQVRCYIFLLTIYKTFIEKFTTYHGLLIEHIKTHMFWECEADARNWPVHRMGTKILNVIEDLNSGLSRNKIPHYFIKGKNIFENIPSKYLQFAQKVFHDVHQFPVMHFIEALKNLKYVHSDFYPFPDLDELYKLLTTKGIKLPPSVKLRKVAKKTRKKSILQVGSQRRKQKPKIDDLKWKKKNEKNNRNKFLGMKQKQKEEDTVKVKTVDENKNLKVAFSSLDIITQVSALKFFTQHFIEIAKQSRKIGPKNQTLFYLKQAWYNTKVLEEIAGVCSDTEDIEQIITKEREMLERESQQDDEEIAPPTPQRNMEHPTFTFHATNPRKPGQLKLKTSFKKMSQSEIDLTKKQKRLMRPKSVGFDDNIEKINFM